jgi:hypothetical protein
MLIEKEKIGKVQEGDLTAKQLRSLVNTFSEAGDALPVVVGHWGALISGAPAGGRIQENSMELKQKKRKQKQRRTR